MAAFSAVPASPMTSRRLPRAVMRAPMSSSVRRPAGLVAGLGGVAGEGCGALGFDLARPFGDGLGVASGVEGGLVAGEASIAVGDSGLGVGAGAAGAGPRRAGPVTGAVIALISQPLSWARRPATRRRG